VRIKRHAGYVLPNLPPSSCQMTLRKLPWPLFQRGGQSVIPAVEKTKQWENRDHLQYLVVVEVTA